MFTVEWDGLRSGGERWIGVRGVTSSHVWCGQCRKVVGTGGMRGKVGSQERAEGGYRAVFLRLGLHRGVTRGSTSC